MYTEKTRDVFRKVSTGPDDSFGFLMWAIVFPAEATEEMRREHVVRDECLDVLRKLHAHMNDVVWRGQTMVVPVPIEPSGYIKDLVELGDFRALNR